MDAKRNAITSGRDLAREPDPASGNAFIWAAVLLSFKKLVANN